MIRRVAARLREDIHRSGDSLQAWRDQHPIDARPGFGVAKTMEGCLIPGAGVGLPPGIRKQTATRERLVDA